MSRDKRGQRGVGTTSPTTGRTPLRAENMAAIEDKFADFVPISPDNGARLNAVADVLGIPSDRRETFVETIAAHVYAASLGGQLYTKEKQRNPQLLAAAKAVRTAYTAVARLTPQQKGHLGILITRPFLVPRTIAELAQKQKGVAFVTEPYDAIRARWGGPPWMDPTMGLDAQDSLAVSLIEALDAALGEFIGRGPHGAPGKRGKPGGAKKRWPMHNFVLTLWCIGRVYGRVTLSNTGGSAGGSIVAALRRLEPMLPKAFYPGILDYPFLRNVQKSLPPDP
jgi:hypothetical protein